MTLALTVALPNPIHAWSIPSFLHVSEFINSTSGSVTQHLAVITLFTTTLTIRLCQLKNNLFRKGHTLYISITNTSNCPIRALL